MQFEELDNKFREAADNHHPAYDEKAWSKMEKLLNKYMPESRNRRFIVFWVLAIGLITGSLLITHPWTSGKKPLPQAQITTAEPKTNPESIPQKQQSFVENKVSPVANSTVGSTVDVSPVVLNVKQTRKTADVRTDIIAKEPTVDLNSNKDYTNPFGINENKNSDKINPVASNNSQVAGPTEKVLNTENKSVTVQNEKTNPVETPVSSNSKSKNKKTHSFFVTLGGGPDISFIKLNDPGKVKLFGGGGIGYTYNNKISLRAGFYTGRKIYSAQADDYYAPAIFYSYYPYLEKVDANCRVYEVPVSLSYNFSKSKTKQFFASAGVSSYFMKEETYRYYYKTTPTSPTTSRDRTITNENRHYFAGLTLSAGYSQNLTRHLSVTVEPYAKLPLKGLGYGNVELNSAGVLFSVGIEPFASKKNK